MFESGSVQCLPVLKGLHYDAKSSSHFIFCPHTRQMIKHEPKTKMKYWYHLTPNTEFSWFCGSGSFTFNMSLWWCIYTAKVQMELQSLLSFFSFSSQEGQYISSESLETGPVIIVSLPKQHEEARLHSKGDWQGRVINQSSHFIILLKELRGEKGQNKLEIIQTLISSDGSWPQWQMSSMTECQSKGVVLLSHSIKELQGGQCQNNKNRAKTNPSTSWKEIKNTAIDTSNRTGENRLPRRKTSQSCEGQACKLKYLATSKCWPLFQMWWFDVMLGSANIVSQLQ